MRLPRSPHRWRVTPREAVALQRRLAGSVCRVFSGRPPRLLAGVDCAFAGGGTRIVAAAVLWEPSTAPEGRIVEQAVVEREVVFPYVPGLLSFREVPAIMAALRRLERRPDVTVWGSPVISASAATCRRSAVPRAASSESTKPPGRRAVSVRHSAMAWSASEPFYGRARGCDPST